MKRYPIATLCKKRGGIFLGIFFSMLAVFSYSQERLFIVETNVAEAEIYLDGDYIGKTSINGSKLIPNVKFGDRIFKIQKSGYGTFEKTIRVSAATGVMEAILQNERPHIINEQKRPSQVLAPRGKPKVQERKNPGNGNTVFLIVFLSIVIVFLVIITLVVLKRSGVRKFDRFRLGGFLGKGGMAVVYSARDPKNKQEVALKLMDAGLIHDKDLVEKFMREGSAIAKINHTFPGAPIVKVFEYGCSGTNPPIPYIVMEKLEGVSLLADFKKNGRYDKEKAFRVVGRVAEALVAAHKNGVFHRDVTPDNVILLNTQGKADLRLIDFGVAKHEYTSYQTLDGSIAGKPPYMSPEQCKGEKVGGRSDIYSLGIILYMLLEGKPPFSSSNPLEIMKMHECQKVPSTSVHLEENERDLMNSMLAKSAGERPDAETVVSRIAAIVKADPLSV